MRTANPVIIPTSNSEFHMVSHLAGGRQTQNLPFPAAARASSKNASTYSLDGTESIDPSNAFTRSPKTFPYSCGLRLGRAIEGWFENLRGVLDQPRNRGVQYVRTSLPRQPLN
jgi:hypothetical protein